MAARSFLPRPPKLPKQERQAEERRLDALWEHCTGKPVSQIELSILRAAAEGGHRRAQCTLGFCYEGGDLGLPRDKAKMFDCWVAAAERRENDVIFQGEGLSEAQFRLGRCYAEGTTGVKKDKELAHMFLWRAAKQGHDRAEVYLRKLERPWDPLYYVKKAVRKKPKRITLVDDLIQPVTRREEAPTSPSSKILDDGEDPTSPVARAKLKRRISDQIEMVKKQAELEVRQERAEKRKKLEELRGAVDLYDVTFGGATLGLSLVLATDHRTKRKMIIVDTIREASPASNILQPQDELVAIGEDFDLPNHILIFEEISKQIERQPRPLTLTFARLHAHRPAVLEKGAVPPPAPAPRLPPAPAPSSAPAAAPAAASPKADAAAAPSAPPPPPPPPPPTTNSPKPKMPPKRASFGDIGDTSTSNDEDIPVVDTPRTAERKGLIGSAMNLIGRMRSPSRDEAPAAPPPPPPPPPPAPAPERPRAASPVHSEAGWATDDMTTASDESWETEPEDDEKRPRAKPLSPDAVAAAGKCPTSLPPPKLNQKRATPEVEKRKPSRPDALAAAGRCPTALPPPRASTNPATSPISPSKPKRNEPDDADATDGERTASPADLNPDLGGGFVASARAAMVRLYERYNPEKVDEVDTLLTKWPGREAQLLSAVEAKYSREEAAPASPAAVPKPADVLAAVMGDAGRTKSPTPERMPREIIFTRDGTP